MKYKLFNDGTVAIINSSGAELKSLVKDEIEYMWSGSEESWNRTSPVLFPIVGGLKGKQTLIKGETYYMNQHGFLRDQEFGLVNQASNKLTLFFESNKMTLKKYPFTFRAEITHTLEKRKLTTEFKIINIDNEEIYFNIGGHPGFSCPLFTGENFSDYKVVFEKSETFSSPNVESDGTLNFEEPLIDFKNLKELPLDYRYFVNDAIVIPKVNSKYCKLVNQSGKGIKFSFSKFSSFALWTHPNQSPFICLEPWIGYADRHNSDGVFEHKDNLVRVQPGKEFSVSYTIEILK